jgi:predicted alpha/beta superfamily hydrolase
MNNPTITNRCRGRPFLREKKESKVNNRDGQSTQNGYGALACIVISLLLNHIGYAQAAEKITIGQKTSIHSKILGKDMQLSIHVPDDYDSSDELYPVLYTFQTHFEQVSGAVKILYDYGLIPKTMVVRIDNYEFGYLTPTQVESNPNSGRADRFLNFFKEELFPFIDTHYRTRPYRIVFSNSWGAMFAAYAVLAKPEIFNAAIASIPWIPFDGEKRYMINNIEKFLSQNEYRNFLYMTMDDESEILPDLEAFLHIFKKLTRQGLDWEYHYWPEEDHTSTPYRSIYSGLRALFKGWNQIPEDIAFKGLGEIKKHEASQKQKFGYDIGVSTAALRKAGQEHQRNNKYDEAIAIFKYAIEKQPGNAFAYVTLGRAYEENNMLQLAKEAFQKAYDLAVAAAEPQVKWIKNFLDGINQKIKDAEK